MSKKPKKAAKAEAAQDHQRAPLVRDVTERGVRRRSGYNTNMSCIYFYYLKERASGKLIAQAHYYDHGDLPIPAGEFDDIVRRLTENAILDMDMPPKMAFDFDQVKWRRKSYLVVVLEDEDSMFDEDDPVIFDEDNSDYDPNHSFFDGELIETRPRVRGQTRTLHGIRVVNHMKRNAKGDDLEIGEPAKYKFRLNYHNARRARLFLPDSGGTNMGPPVPPPVRL